jgi:hypothetical protein
MESTHYVDEASINRFLAMCEMTEERLRTMSAADRDRMLQTHLSAARGPDKNFELMCETIDFLRSARSGGKTCG